MWSFMCGGSPCDDQAAGARWLSLGRRFGVLFLHDHRASRFCVRRALLYHPRRNLPSMSRPLRALDEMCATRAQRTFIQSGLNPPNALKNRRYTTVNVQRRRVLADDGLDGQQPQSRLPCFAAAAMCSAVIMLTRNCRNPTALEIQHQSMLTSIMLTMPGQHHSR